MTNAKVSSSGRILVVDDTPANIQTLSSILKERGYQISVATNGRQALDVVSKIRPDLILLDVMMPDMDGLQICRMLRTIPGIGDSAIIMVSAKAMPSEQAAGLRAGADDYITKPFDDAELLETLRKYSESLKREQDLISVPTDSEDLEIKYRRTF